jgi:hypothetical protein
MQDGAGVLLDASTDAKASKLVAASTPKIRYVAVDTGPSMLIRPDACIAWVGEESSTEGLEEALRRWFNPTIFEPIETSCASIDSAFDLARSSQGT